MYVNMNSYIVLLSFVVVVFGNVTAGVGRNLEKEKISLKIHSPPAALSVLSPSYQTTMGLCTRFTQ